jgi:hypothetical protein
MRLAMKPVFASLFATPGREQAERELDQNRSAEESQSSGGP